ncbi:GntR family transcriptional regulator [Clostridium felsineum]|uniref:GntR family transcriptional regulator n=1 Tax=Clostridium felsineum TaxID=36839 RepID=UPI0009C94F7E|nr:GntR family transcriptional regulator [Clostridium felsineum]URZ18672.1 HTH-type transcriptional repressor YtrA [Clostridium felsineum DSM 794]
MLISIDFNSNIPIYIQIYNQFLSFIINGILKDGEKLPSARSLAKQLELNVLTINKTYKKLRDEGLIDIYPKKGSFVNISKKQIYSQDYINQKLQYEINNLVLTSYEYKIDLQIVLNSLIYTYNNFIKGDNGNDE